MSLDISRKGRLGDLTKQLKTVVSVSKVKEEFVVVVDNANQPPFTSAMVVDMIWKKPRAAKGVETTDKLDVYAPKYNLLCYALVGSGANPLSTNLTNLEFDS